MSVATFEWPSIAGESAEDRFHRLAEQWDEESALISSVTEMVMLPSYQKIIGMGWAAVPLMLEDLKNEPRHWFAALRAITDINPVPPEDAGNVRKMAAAWAAEDEDRWWWPDSEGNYYWPASVSREETLEAFKLAYGQLGYEECSNSDYKEGWQKVAIFVDNAGKPIHAARQLVSDVWTSNVDALKRLNMHCTA